MDEIPCVTSTDHYPLNPITVTLMSSSGQVAICWISDPSSVEFVFRFLKETEYEVVPENWPNFQTFPSLSSGLGWRFHTKLISRDLPVRAGTASLV